VVLTFLYSTCPDICPVISQKLRQAHEALGPDAAKVALLVVSVDPERDTVEQLRGYTKAVGMTGRWHFLTGERDALARVWAAYGIGVFPGPNGAISHTDAIYLIDKEGRRRVLMRGELQPDELVSNLRILMR
jgi:protein SCO1/2